MSARIDALVAAALSLHSLPTNQKGPSAMDEDWPFRGRRATPEQKRNLAIAEARRILAAAGVKADIVLKTPQWKPGDVVVVRHNGPDSFPYTYVRSLNNWPGASFPKTDEQIDALFLEGKAKPVLEHGGVPFSPSRLP